MKRGDEGKTKGVTMASVVVVLCFFFCFALPLENLFLSRSFSPSPSFMLLGELGEVSKKIKYRGEGSVVV